MPFTEERLNTPDIPGEDRLQPPVHPGSVLLRLAVRRNIVSFPSQIPIFSALPPADMQWRMVVLFFVRGWSTVNIAARFGVPVQIGRAHV